MRQTFAALALFSLAYFFWPYIALFDLYISLETADKKSVQGSIDWPPLKKELKVDILRFIDFQLKEGQKGKRTRVSFDSNSLAQQVVDQVATPEGIIFLYHHPDDFIKNIKEVFEKTANPQKLSLPEKEKPFSLEGPNFSSLMNRIQYLFFTSFSTFKIEFKIHKKLFVMKMQRQGFSWQVVHLRLPLGA